MSSKSKPVIAITAGDPAGIGPEIAEKAARNRAVTSACVPLIIGGAAGFIPSRPSPASGRAAVRFLDEALALLADKKADALVTAPAPKASFGKIGGHTEYLSKATGAKRVEMLMIAGGLRVLLLTRHIPLKDVSGEISVKKIADAAEQAGNYVRKYFLQNSRPPRIAVCGLNPHLSDGGLAGSEEKKIIAPAVEKLAEKGMCASGPLLAETVFGSGGKNFDLIVCMYHDQGMLPLKLIAPSKIVNLTIGLPFVRTSPGHGTAYDIAGKGIADPRPMIEAVKLACRLVKNGRQ